MSRSSCPARGPFPRFAPAPATAFALGLALALAPVSAAANLISNGSFELGPPVDMVTPLAPPSTAIQGWTVVGATIDYVGGRWAAREGARSVALNGTSPGSIAQAFPTVAGQPYTVKFFLAGDAFSSPLFKNIRVSAAGQSADHVFDASHAWPWEMGWSERTFQFTANAGTTTLQFTSLDADSTGPVIDSVVVTGPSPVGVGDGAVRGFALAAPWPNPSRDGFALHFTLPAESAVRLSVHDVQGRTVREIAAGTLPAGAHLRTWDGRTATGRAAPGFYLVRLSAPGVEIVRKAVLTP